MQQDFYLDERWLASYFEKDWFDHVLRGQSNIDNKFYYSKFDPNYLYSDYHEKLVEFLTNELSKIPASPISYLEIGSSLGRTFYELCVKQKSIRTATLIEPSENLASCFLKIFGTQDSAEFKILKGNMNLDKVLFNSNHIRIAASNVDYSLINKSFQEAKDLKSAELVVCSNVIDQCQDPLALVELVKSLVAPNGFLVLSCTYQWNDKYVTNGVEPIANINDLFDDGWLLLNETNVPFKCRRHERYWMNFLSHISIFQNKIDS